MSGRYLPNLPEISREALAVVAGAIIAAVIFQQFPALRAWVKARMPSA